MTKVLTIISSLGIGGAERLVCDIAKNINKNEYDMTVLSLYKKSNSIYDEYMQENYVKMIYLNKKSGIDMTIITKIRREIKKIKPDVVHTHLNGLIYSIVLTVLIPLKLNTEHSMPIFSYDTNAIFRIIMWISYRYLNVIPVAISDQMKNSICKYFKLPLSKVFCIYNGIDTKRFHPIKKGETKRINIVMTGSFQPLKNHKMLIDIFGKLTKHYNNIHLNLIGDGGGRKNIEEQIAYLDLKEKITLFGIVKNVEEILANSDIYVCSSTTEGFSLAILEAMACGLPIISTKSGGPVDIVHDGGNGLLVDVDDFNGMYNAIKKLIDEKEMRGNMGRISRIYAEKYDIKKCVRQYEQMYSGII